MRIVKVEDADTIRSAAGLFDGPTLASATGRFVGSAGHHLFFGYDVLAEDAPTGDDLSGAAERVVGFVTGIEMTHPDKGTEMFLYELGVIAEARRHGYGSELVRALAAFAERRGCTGMWVAVDADNDAALITYQRAGALAPEPCVVLSWEFDRADAQLPLPGLDGAAQPESEDSFIEASQAL